MLLQCHQSGPSNHLMLASNGTVMLRYTARLMGYQLQQLHGRKRQVMWTMWAALWSTNEFGKAQEIIIYRKSISFFNPYFKLNSACFCISLTYVMQAQRVCTKSRGTIYGNIIFVSHFCIRKVALFVKHCSFYCIISVYKFLSMVLSQYYLVVSNSTKWSCGIIIMNVAKMPSNPS